MSQISLCLLLAYKLEAEGYVVESVERGDEAELQLAESAPDLIILDWMLRGASVVPPHPPCLLQASVRPLRVMWQGEAARCEARYRWSLSHLAI